MLRVRLVSICFRYKSNRYVPDNFFFFDTRLETAQSRYGPIAVVFSSLSVTANYVFLEFVLTEFPPKKKNVLPETPNQECRFLQKLTKLVTEKNGIFNFFFFFPYIVDRKFYRNKIFAKPVTRLKYEYASYTERRVFHISPAPKYRFSFSFNTPYVWCACSFRQFSLSPFPQYTYRTVV